MKTKKILKKLFKTFGNGIIGIFLVFGLALISFYVFGKIGEKENSAVIVNNEKITENKKEITKNKEKSLSGAILKKEQIKITPQYDFCAEVPEKIASYFGVPKACGFNEGNAGRLLVEINSEKEISLDEIKYSDKKEKLGKNKFLIFPYWNPKMEAYYFHDLEIFGKKYNLDYEKYFRKNNFTEFKKIENNKYYINIDDGRGAYSYIFDKEGNIETDYGVIKRKGFYTDFKYMCGADPDGYIILNYWENDKSTKAIKMKDFKFTGYSKCGDLKTISKDEFKKLGGKKEILITNNFLNKIHDIEGFLGLCFSNNYGYNSIGEYRLNDIGLKGKVKFFYNKLNDNYSFLLYDKNSKLLKPVLCDGMDGSAWSYYNTYINGKIIGYEEKLENEYGNEATSIKEKIIFLEKHPKLKEKKISKVEKNGVKMYVIKGKKNFKYDFDFIPGEGVKIYGSNLDKNISKISVKPLLEYEPNEKYFPETAEHNSKRIYISDLESYNLKGHKKGNSSFVYNGFYKYNVFSPKGGGAFKISFTDEHGESFEDLIAIESYDKKYLAQNKCFDFDKKLWEQLKKDKDLGEDVKLCENNSEGKIYIENKKTYIYSYPFKWFKIDELFLNFYSLDKTPFAIVHKMRTHIYIDNRDYENFCIENNKIIYGEKCIKKAVNKIGKIDLYNKDDKIIFIGKENFSNTNLLENDISEGLYILRKNGYFYVIQGKKKSNDFGFKKRIGIDGGFGYVKYKYYELLNKKEKEYYKKGGKVSYSFIKNLFGDYIYNTEKCKNNVQDILDSFDKYKFELKFQKDLNSDKYLFEIYVNGEKFRPKCIEE